MIDKLIFSVTSMSINFWYQLILISRLNRLILMIINIDDIDWFSISIFINWLHLEACRPSMNYNHGRDEGQKNPSNTCKWSVTWHLPSQMHSFLFWNLVDDLKAQSQSMNLFASKRPHTSTLDMEFSIQEFSNSWSIMKTRNGAFFSITKARGP